MKNPTMSGAGPMPQQQGQAQQPPAMVVQVPTAALSLSDGVDDGHGGGSNGGGASGKQVMPGQGDEVTMVLEGTVQSIDGGQATIAVSSINGAPIDGGGDDQDDQSASGPSEDDMRAMAAKADDENSGGY